MKKFLVQSSWRTALGNLLPSAHGHQGGSRFAVIGSMLFVAFAVVGCDDSSSTSAGPNDESGVELSSSSRGRVSEPAEVMSSSSEKAKSSSSGAQSDAKRSSSSEKFGKSSSSENEASLSSEKQKSSSSVKSSSSAESSSGGKDLSSSSSVDPISSSSVQGDVSSSSSSAGEVNCSALLEGETGWNWNVPKECRFNPDIDYGSMTDERDGKVYKTVIIGTQVWMAENLNYYDAADLNVKEKSWCFGKSDNGDSTTCDVAGRLYTWAAAIDSVKLATEATNPLDCGYGKECGLKDTVQGVCPSGWHLPSKTEWKALFTEVGGESTAGKVLKSETGWNKNSNGTDDFGFSALPVGYRKGDGYYVDGDKTLFWSSTEDGNFDAFSMLLSNTVHRANLAELNYNIKGYGFSVRCVKD